ncbi:L,D-transpeptidase [Lutimaribacter sp. EGI FJ00015]|uniref:L,D-transpeptidase n=1 Tax=Lutimaribacter degradans TaxID=2945989 RepID=A0ACC5ZYI4_9RHOB|nr:L,D-transpeptidase [Lutimaribacter sp. EGI FJ00013]MCM2563248.1 L,D-transpeptidase [Lutimaribacter sp. EGI FJ00013]MCO0614429.1 L,D-transpeptidase [Lutimaribacter sp. EGI FJ00015]MCO0635970.1 L,D-transpeptidase [Lutimaribacter sp. EGI FJ00014]
MLTRRHFIVTSAALFSAPLATPAAARPSKAQMEAWDAQVTPVGFDPATTNPWGLHPRFLPQQVEARDGLEAGSIHVDAVARYLYHVQGDGTAMRYGVAIARGELYTPGRYTIRYKKKWPSWTPTQAMIARDPELYAQHADGMSPGPNNPLGSRAFYLFRGQRDTYLRIHGSPEPRSIGGRASSGCVRMVMAHINQLYPNVEHGSTAVLYPPERITAQS